MPHVRAARVFVLSVAAAGSIVLLALGCDQRLTSATAPAATPAAHAPLPEDATATAAAVDVAVDHASIDRGRYLIKVGGCNDCHTPGFMEKGYAVPESQWLTGVPVGWRGPWGTTYASNLRRFVKDFDEDTFVQTVRARTSRPPMPWPNLHSMSDADVRSLFRYIKSLPLTGDATPEFVPPGNEPKTAYIDMMPKSPMVARAAVGAGSEATTIVR